MIKLIVILILLAIILSLGVALFSLVRNKDHDSTKTVKALTVRIGLSIGLIILIFLASAFGLLPMHGI